MSRTIFITGTDTGVGKTALTALLLAESQSAGRQVRALKPFSSGDGGDEALLRSLQGHAQPINFFHYPEPISPWSASRIHSRPVALDAALRPIREHSAQCDLLLVEGAGGLLTPLGDDFDAADLIVEFAADVIIVASNRLGVLNHTLLTVEALQHRGVQRIKVALMELGGGDLSRKTNAADLRDLLRGIPVVQIPYLENYRPEAGFIRNSASAIRGELNQLLSV